MFEIDTEMSEKRTISTSRLETLAATPSWELDPYERQAMAAELLDARAALSAQPAPPEAELGKHKWVPSTRSYDETICVYCMGTNRELAALGELDYCSKAPAAPPTDAGFNAGIDAAASALEDAWSQDMSMPEALAALNSLRKAQNG